MIVDHNDNASEHFLTREISEINISNINYSNIKYLF